MDLLSIQVKNRVERSEIVAGDHIYSWRAFFLYSLLGIYVDDGLVIHFTAPPGKLTASTKDFLSLISRSLIFEFSSGGAHKKLVQITVNGVGVHENRERGSRPLLDCFKGEGSLYRYVYGVTEKAFRYQLRGGTCATAPSDRECTVLQMANYLFENGFGNYDSVKNNCEDFAFYCKTGILTLDDKGPRMSGQIAYLARMFPKMAEKYFSISKEAVEERWLNYL